ncbi:cupin domain-containing protein [Jeongeupia wiesaeckerbachi]|uniref:cupin domain-containing protein n=1 Tax=Jeongeupia wiesaeckerbachi TaxID=3051218 RepID=UPI003D800AE1
MNAILPTTIIRDEFDWLPVPLPGAEGVSFKVLKADTETKQVVLRARFSPGSRMPRHFHFCRAVAYTLSGEWSYDEGHFKAGDMAYEVEGNTHTPWSDEGAELLLVFRSDQEAFLDNYLADGSATIRLGMKFFVAYEGKSLAEAAMIDLHSLIELLPPPSAQ